ncbi:MAG: adenylate kinase [Flavobacteriaceae bacterium]|nr:adenylate kinase [Flavobacteriaceae bacterium]MCY4215572.1 adenylate kinase [Flavobacteriaceae bacterium]MCY4253352.1 adenylate kinase [Flavobacteriaceae bacterium]
MKNFIFFGKPGAGKGTQAQRVKQKYGLIHISTGDLFRKHIANKTSLGKSVQVYLDKGALVPDRVTIDMLENEFQSAENPKGYILDGFPRTVGQAKSLERFFNRLKLNLNAVVSIEVDRQLLIDRLLNRGKISGRTDDLDIVKINNRFQEYDLKTNPLIEFYQSRNLFYPIDGHGTIHEISQRLYELIDHIS